jgi:hypothetical protein
VGFFGCWPTGSVRQTAGRTFSDEKSSNGKGSSTPLPLTIERLPILGGVNIFLGMGEKIEDRVGDRRTSPFQFRNVILLIDQDDNPYPAGTRDG